MCINIISLADCKDQSVFGGIYDLGIRSQAPKEQFEEPCSLAAGPADLVIILQ